jgi:hypothetical protein
MTRLSKTLGQKPRPHMVPEKECGIGRKRSRHMLTFTVRMLKRHFALPAVSALIFFFSVRLPAQDPMPRPLGGAQCGTGGHYDVIVVGAGLAGLAAAKELKRLGHSVLPWRRTTASADALTWAGLARRLAFPSTTGARGSTALPPIR